jgi:hypothetical protein
MRGHMNVKLHGFLQNVAQYGAKLCIKWTNTGHDWYNLHLYFLFFSLCLTYIEYLSSFVK